MKHLSWLIPALIIWMLAPIPPSLQHAGAYNYTSHLMYCRTQLACLHEVGHRLDQLAGYPSQSEEFNQALQMYLYVEMRKPVLSEIPASILELTYRNGSMDNTKKEIYAYIFAWSHGDINAIPDGLRKFYDFFDVRRLMLNIKPNQSIYWLN